MNLIVTNANVITLDEQNSRAEAVAILGGRIVRVGTNEEAMSMAVDPVTVLDLQGKTVAPGFVESHIHPVMAAHYNLEMVNCGTPPNRTIADIVEKLGEAAKQVGRGEWISGRGFDDSLVEDMRHITRQDIDAAVPNNPVYISYVAGHLSYANSRALELVGVTRSTPDPVGGRIDRDASGNATGLLYERAGNLVRFLVPQPGVSQMVDGLEWAAKQLLKTGVTSLHDTGNPIGGFSAYQIAARQGKFPIRAYVARSFMSMLERESPLDVVPKYAEAELRSGFGGDDIKVGILKIGADGSIQGHSGALTSPYYDRPDESGILIMPQEQLNVLVDQGNRADFQVGIHGNGDAAIDAILDAFEYTLDRYPKRDHRFRIEHCQAVREDQLDRMAEMGVLASFFNLHVYHWGDRHRDLFLGPERGPRISPLKSALDRGIKFGGHSDWFVTPVDPMLNVHTAANRLTRDGNELGPEFCLTPEQSLRSMTIDAAYLAFEENDKGTIEPGKLGDVVVLSDDPLAVGARRIDDIEVDATIIGGRVLCDRAVDGGSRKDERNARDPRNPDAYF